MSTNRPAPRAASRYKQVRLQFTEEAGGFVSVSLYVKPLNAAWDEHQCILRDRVRQPRGLQTLEDAIGCCIELLEDYRL